MEPKTVLGVDEILVGRPQALAQQDADLFGHEGHRGDQLVERILRQRENRGVLGTGANHRATRLSGQHAHLAETVALDQVPNHLFLAFGGCLDDIRAALADEVQVFPF